MGTGEKWQEQKGTGEKQREVERDKGEGGQQGEAGEKQLEQERSRVGTG